MLKFQNLALIRSGAKHEGFEIFLAEEMLEGGVGRKSQGI